MSSGGSSLRATFTEKATLNVKIGAFVQAAKELVALSAKMDAEITGACKRMAADLGVAPEKLKPAQGQSTKLVLLCGDGLSLEAVEA